MSISMLRTALRGISRITVTSEMIPARVSISEMRLNQEKKRYFADNVKSVDITSDKTSIDNHDNKETIKPQELKVDITNDESFNGFFDSLINIVDSNKTNKIDDTSKENIKMFLSDPIIRKIYNECKHTYLKNQSKNNVSSLPSSFNTEFIKMCQLESVLNDSDIPSEENSRGNKQNYDIESKYHVHKLAHPEIDLEKTIDFENISKDFEFIKKEDIEDNNMLYNLVDNTHLKDIETTNTNTNTNTNKVVHDILYVYKYLIDQVRSTYILNGDEDITENETKEEKEEEAIPYEEILKEMKNENKTTFPEHATGKRKESSAQVCITSGNGQIIINHKPIYEYFRSVDSRENIIIPFLYTNTDITKYDIKIHMEGGGLTGQAEAARLGISKLLAARSQDNYDILKAADFLYRDPRSVERKKAGRRKARKPQQWVKR